MDITIAGLLSVFVAGATTALYATIVWWFDHYEREPWWLLSLAFFWGAVPAVIISLFAEVGFNVPLAALAGQSSEILGVALVAPLVEEVAKALALAGIYWLFRSEFDDLMDGILYGTLIGFGFAMTENILYFINAFAHQGWGAWAMTVFLRSIIFGFNHAFFTGITGLGFGYARMAPTAWKRNAAPFLALLVAMAFHFSHNLFVSLGGAACFLSLFSDSIGVVAIFVLLFVAGWQEKKWIQEELEPEREAGHLSAGELAEAASYLRRLGGQWAAFSESGWAGFRARMRWQQQLTELAFKKRQRRRRGDAGCSAEEVERYRTALFDRR
ncbi:MAG: PrsW family intramembrane metalloprotease [Chloroflexi bacterium]|nr:PrsW family intramembrane metalloprotease [Chloroflexota bacterium]